MIKLTSFHAISAVWLRYFAVFRKDMTYALITTFVEPFLYLASFGFGLGKIVGDLNVDGITMSYRAFVLGGMIGQTILFTAFFDGAFGGFVRMYYQKIFQAIAVTPVTLSEVLWGELLWCTTRTLLSTFMVLAIGLVIGDFSPIGVLLLLPFLVLAAFLFAGFGMLVAGLSRTIESISYPQYLVIFPMFLFCGVYFPVTQLPSWGRWIAELLPLTAILAIARSFTLGVPFQWWSPVVLIIWTLAMVFGGRRAMTKRLIA